MVTIVTRAVGALLALVGLALIVVGVWFATQLGGSGTAQFTVHPQPGRPVLITPDVLNRVDGDVTVTATTAGDGRVWMALANPSDATAVLKDARRVEVTGVDVRDWALLTTSRGGGEPPALGTADLWRQQDDGTGRVSLTVEQSQAPESVVVAADSGSITTLTLTVTDKRWFVEAVVAALVGLFLLAAGAVALWPRRRRGGTGIPSTALDGDTPAPGPAPAAGTDTTDPAATTDTTDHPDPGATDSAHPPASPPVHRSDTEEVTR
ncbi:hypothetical protein [Nostocoides sp. Soil756]|uniref:hypothetical protein n=1 Tax=Nostocoides sp. Soil756 TaxID=1736399 RepID=UPI0006F85EA2|nr:hypothetical protein [Tetrasphaera sp. Soil756]KRE61304.1 hypothetical protein ASG78_13355 [Tetrasphaera sp. Soil756]